ncbi:MAG: hypothetical protein KJO21_04665 [Verrucomicrobiae bacterium]|nr:hypothetical protein [Verrucomicrobiae bacterium]NNJ43016.1 hypothetical protein [Akkermansiaceae bacterium]
MTAYIKQFTGHLARLTFLSAFAFLISCGEKQKKESNSADEFFVGNWVAQGPQFLGPKHGNYGIHLELKADGKAIMNIKNHINTTALSFKHSDIIKLEGTWTSGYDGVSLNLKVTEWSTTSSEQINSTDFFNQYDFKVEDDKMFLSGISRDIKIGTTEGALEAERATSLKMAKHKGKGVSIPNVTFIRQ